MTGGEAHCPAAGEGPRPGMCRRALLAAGGLAGALAASSCAATTFDPGRAPGGGAGGPSPGGSAPPPGGAAAPSRGAAPREGNGPAAAAVLGASAGVPVGGGVVFRRQQVVVTQPTEGSFRAFTAVCPHARCLVDRVEEGVIVCPCHNSTFSITDGAVIRGPADRPLRGYRVTDDGGQLRLA